MRIYDLEKNAEGQLVMTTPPLARTIPGMDQPVVWQGQSRKDLGADPTEFSKHFNTFQKICKLAEGFVVRPSILMEFITAMSFEGSDLTLHRRVKFPRVDIVGRSGPFSEALFDMLVLIRVAKSSSLYLIAAAEDTRDAVTIYLEHRPN